MKWLSETMKFFVKLDPKNPKRQPFPYFESPPGLPVIQPENPNEPKDGGVPDQEGSRPKKRLEVSER